MGPGDKETLARPTHFDRHAACAYLSALSAYSSARGCVKRGGRVQPFNTIGCALPSVEGGNRTCRGYCLLSLHSEGRDAETDGRADGGGAVVRRPSGRPTELVASNTFVRIEVSSFFIALFPLGRCT